MKSVEEDTLEQKMKLSSKRQICPQRDTIARQPFSYKLGRLLLWIHAFTNSNFGSKRVENFKLNLNVKIFQILCQRYLLFCKLPHIFGALSLFCNLDDFSRRLLVIVCGGREDIRTAASRYIKDSRSWIINKLLSQKPPLFPCKTRTKQATRVF